MTASYTDFLVLCVYSCVLHNTAVGTGMPCTFTLGNLVLFSSGMHTLATSRVRISST